MSNPHFSIPNFVQVTNPDGINAMRALTKKHPQAASLFYILMEHMNENNCVMVSMALLARKMGVSRQTTSKAVTYLKTHRYLVVYKVGTTNAYSLNADLVWKSKSGDNRFEAMLTGKVLLTLDEQDDDVQIRVKKSMHQLELIK